MRFFLDSNVLVSGIVFSGTERWILLATFRGEHTFVISQDVQHEVLEVMQEKFPRRREEAREVLSLLRVEIVPRRAYARRSRESPDSEIQEMLMSWQPQSFPIAMPS